MPTKFITKFSPIVIDGGLLVEEGDFTFDQTDGSSGSTSSNLDDDVEVTVTTEHCKADLELSPTLFIIKQKEGKILILPNVKWLEGITISISVLGVLYPTTYMVKSNPYLYDPEQRLYSKNLLNSATHQTLLSEGLATTDEVTLLEKMGPKLTIIFDKLAQVICAQFTYDNSSTNTTVFRVLSFRAMQQRLFLLGLDSLVETILFSPGPSRDWFREAYIDAIRSDSTIQEELPQLDADISRLENTMTASNLNTQIIESLDTHIEPGTPEFNLAKAITVVFCAMRYTHDNTKFSY